MNVAGSEADAACKLSAMEDSLGEVLWRLHIPSVDYRSFRAAQKVISAQIQKRAHKFISTFKFMLWIVCFLFTSCIISYYESGAASGFSIVLLLLSVALFIFSIDQNWAVCKALYDGHRNHPSDFMIGEGGILHVSDFDIRLFPWDGLLLLSKDGHGHYLVAENFTVLILPEAALGQHPAASEIVAFIDQKMARLGSF
jgi:hypothetical protein